MLIRQGISILRRFKSCTLRHFIDEIKTKALLDSRAFFVKYRIGQGLAGLDEKGIEKTKKLLNYCTLFSDDLQISSVRAVQYFYYKKTPGFYTSFHNKLTIVKDWMNPPHDSLLNPPLQFFLLNPVIVVNNPTWF